MRELFLQAGWDVVDFADRADVYVVNTCTVTQTSDTKSRRMLARAHRANPNALVVAVGCYAQVAPETVSALDGVGLVLGTGPEADRRASERSACGKRGEIGDYAAFRAENLRAALRRSRLTHARHAQDSGRLRELLFLLHHSVCPRAAQIPPARRDHAGSGRACRRGVSRDRAHGHPSGELRARPEGAL